MNPKDLAQIKDNFVRELQQAESGEKNSLAFIVNTIPEKPLVSEGEVFEVLTIGGTVCRKALIKKSGGNLEIIEQADGTLTTFKTKQDLLDCVVRLLDPQVTVVAINFAYPLEPVFNGDKLDAILLRGTKEHQFEGLTGEMVGKAIEDFVKEKLDRDIQVSVANDTICLLLSGLTRVSWDKLAAGIVGTGFNFALFLDKGKLVNLECGNFDKLPQSIEGKQIDQTSADPGRQILEKELAGAYLFRHFNLMVQSAGLNYPEINSTKQIDEALSGADPEISRIAQTVTQRSARLVACVVAAIMEYRRSSLSFVMEGSLFWKGTNYYSIVEETVKQLTPNYKVEFIHVEDSTILGGAKLVV